MFQDVSGCFSMCVATAGVLRIVEYLNRGVVACAPVCLSYLRVVTVVVVIVGVGSVGAPVTLLEHFLGFGRHPRLALSHATFRRSGTHTYTQVRGLQVWEASRWRKFTVWVAVYEIFDQSGSWCWRISSNRVFIQIKEHFVHISWCHRCFNEASWFNNVLITQIIIII